MAGICHMRVAVTEVAKLNRFRHVLITALVILSLSGMSKEAECMPNPKANFYVSTEGNDRWSGMLPEPNPMRTDGPFASIARAQRAARERGPAAVLIRRGTYFLAEPLMFTPDDSGTTYAAYPGEKPVISGGRKITGFTRNNQGAWQVELPEVKAGKWYFRDLYVNGERRSRPRLPTTGFHHIAEIIPDVRNAFKYADGQFYGWRNLNDVEVVIFNAWDDLRFRIDGIDADTRTVTFTGSNNWDFGRWGKPVRFYIENVGESLYELGKWYLDRHTGVLEYFPMDGERMNQTEVIAPCLEQLVRIDGDPDNSEYVERLTLKGLTFQHSGWTLPKEGATPVQAAYKVPGAIVAKGARRCTIEDCVITKVGTYGIDFYHGCQDNRIINNHIYDMGAGGIKIGEPLNEAPENIRTERNLVSKNHIHDGGVTHHSAVGIWIAGSGRNTISRNHIHDLYYTGISVGWRWGYAYSPAVENIIEYNHIHDLGKGLLSDMGGIYTLGPSQGTVLRGNLIHDVMAYSYGGWGIYFDEGTTGILAENNIVYNTKTGGFHQHYGKENIVRNNVFAFSKIGQLQRTRAEEHLSFTFENNIVYWTEGPLFHGNWSGNMFKLDKNIYWNASGGKVEFPGGAEAWKVLGMDVDSVIADPLFVDAAKYDFHLKKDSPALKLGFKPIAKVGDK